jgi:hypothetical protein
MTIGSASAHDGNHVALCGRRCPQLAERRAERIGALLIPCPLGFIDQIRQRGERIPVLGTIMERRRGNPFFSQRSMRKPAHSQAEGHGFEPRVPLQARFDLDGEPRFRVRPNVRVRAEASMR